MVLWSEGGGNEQSLIISSERGRRTERGRRGKEEESAFLWFSLVPLPVRRDRRRQTGRARDREGQRATLDESLDELKQVREQRMGSKKSE